jgi:hypothetical protein
MEMEQKLLPEQWISTLEWVTQLLYFSQFTCNAFYLSTTIYETSTAPTRPMAVLTNQNSNNCSTITTTPALVNKNRTIFYADFV